LNTVLGKTPNDSPGSRFIDGGTANFAARETLAVWSDAVTIATERTLAQSQSLLEDIERRQCEFEARLADSRAALQRSDRLLKQLSDTLKRSRQAPPRRPLISHR
jgi:hypothetical protein